MKRTSFALSAHNSGEEYESSQYNSSPQSGQREASPELNWRSFSGLHFARLRRPMHMRWQLKQVTAVVTKSISTAPGEVHAQNREISGSMSR
jgi:hypothetical protein